MGKSFNFTCAAVVVVFLVKQNKTKNYKPASE
jgi:hypothetical protein